MRRPETILGERGFTLLEVLVATAIIGISMGVLMSGLAQSHRQAYRGKLAMEAASVAQDLLRRFQEKGFPDAADAPVEGREGWHYQTKVQDLTIKVRTGGMEQKELDVSDLREFTLTIHPPENAAPFILTMWIRPSEVLQ